MDPEIIARRAASYRSFLDREKKKVEELEAKAKIELEKQKKELDDFISDLNLYNLAVASLVDLISQLENSNSIYGIHFCLEEIYEKIKNLVDTAKKIDNQKDSVIVNETSSLLENYLKQMPSLASTLNGYVYEIITTISENKLATFNINTGHGSDVSEKIVSRTKDLLSLVGEGEESIDVVIMDTSEDEELALRLQAEETDWAEY